MARRIRWQIVIAVAGALLIAGLMVRLALSNTTVASPQVGGVYVEAVLGTPTQTIPLLNDPLVDPAGRDLSALLFDGLTRTGADGLPEPALAQSFEVDDTGEVYTFRLRRDVTWHDGQPFTARDVTFTLRSIQNARFGGSPALAAVWQNVLVDQLDDYTVRCTLRAPYAPFLAVARVPILPAHLLDGVAIDQWPASPFARQPVGTGPYKLTELTGERARLEANPQYFGGRPLIDQIELRFIATEEAALSGLSRGDIQAAGGNAAELGQLRLPSNVRRLNVPLDEYAVLTFNLREEPLSEPALRQALARGLDKDALIADALEGQAARIDTPILPGWWAFDPSTRWYPADATRAAVLLGELGYTLGADGVRVRDGQPLAFDLLTDGEPGRVAAASEIARQWGAIGVKVEVQQLEPEALRQRLREHNFTLALHSWARLGPDPDVFELWHSSQADDGLNYAGLRDEAVDSLLAGARGETELALRSDDYAGFQKRWVELVPSITLYQPLYTFIFDTRLGGLHFDVDENAGPPPLLAGREDRYRLVTRWFVNSSREIRSNLRP